MNQIPEEHREEFKSHMEGFYLGRFCYTYDNEVANEIVNNAKHIKFYIDLLIAELFKTSPNVVYFDILAF